MVSANIIQLNTAQPAGCGIKSSVYNDITIREIEKFIIREPPTGEKNDYDSENSWISDGLPSSSRRRRRGGGRWEVGEWREK